MEKSHIILGVTGGSGSGKTTFIRELRSSFDISDVCILSLDNYYKKRNEQVLDENGIHNFDLPDSIKSDELLQDIQALLKGDTVHRQEYTFNNADATPVMKTYLPAPVIIVEGLFVMHYPEIRRLMDVKIFVEAKENIKIARRIQRDRLERNYPLEDVLYRYQYHVSPSYEQYIAPYKELCDIVILNNYNFINAFKIIKSFIKLEVLKSIDNRE